MLFDENGIFVKKHYFMLCLNQYWTRVMTPTHREGFHLIEERARQRKLLFQATKDTYVPEFGGYPFSHSIVIISDYRPDINN